MKIKVLIASIFIGICALTGAQNANAATPYDDILQIQPWYDLHVNTGTGITTQDLVDWFSTVSSGNCSPTDREAIVTALNNGNDYYFTQVVTNTVILRLDMVGLGFVEPDWNEDTQSLTMDTITDGKTIYFQNTTGSFRYQCDTSNTSPTLSQANGDYKLAEYRGFDLNYPEGYEGLRLDPVFPPQGDNNWTPNLSPQMSQDWLATISDTNFNTFDPTLFTCLEDLAPIIHYEIWDRTEDPELLISSGSQSPTVPIVYQFPRLDTDNDYRVVAWYDCGEPPEYQFEHSSFIDFTITRNGTLGQNLLDECVTEIFPFMDLNACLNNMYTVVNSLYFGDIAFPTWSLGSDCTNLHTFAGWLNLEDGYQVCAMIPEETRDVVTPFVGFMLGIVTLGFVHRRSGEFNG